MSSLIFRINTMLPHIDSLTYGSSALQSGFILPEVRLPLLKTGTYDFIVNWGDGSAPQRVTNADLRGAHHAYSKYDEFEVTITGHCDGWSFPGVRDEPGRSSQAITNRRHMENLAYSIVELKAWGSLTIQADMFDGCPYMCITAPEQHHIDIVNKGRAKIPTQRVALPKLRAQCPYYDFWSYSGPSLADMAGN
jgi:hypothetical protein